ncbi:hypothetical protein [Nocardia sp. NPDC051463]|uniref:hypothetical protein n=1 Tax=Nocardia sp. NPDC051463 TaxID=3154845 RepID=UPI0034280D7C
MLDPMYPAHETLPLEANSRRYNALSDLDDLDALRTATAQFIFESDRRATPDYLRVRTLSESACSNSALPIQMPRAARCRPRARCATGADSAGASALPNCYWCGDSQDGSAREARDCVVRAVAVFEEQPDVPDALGALYAGACALADPARLDAARLRTAVLDYADRIGTDPRRYARIAGPDLERRMKQLPPQHISVRDPYAARTGGPLAELLADTRGAAADHSATITVIGSPVLRCETAHRSRIRSCQFLGIKEPGAHRPVSGGDVRDRRTVNRSTTPAAGHNSCSSAHGAVAMAR